MVQQLWSLAKTKPSLESFGQDTDCAHCPISPLILHMAMQATLPSPFFQLLFPLPSISTQLQVLLLMSTLIITKENPHPWLLPVTSTSRSTQSICVLVCIWNKTALIHSGNRPKYLKCICFTSGMSTKTTCSMHRITSAWIVGYCTS